MEGEGGKEKRRGGRVGKGGREGGGRGNMHHDFRGAGRP